MSVYRRGNGTQQRRAGSGRFRRTTMDDFGIGTAVCPACSSVTTWELLVLDVNGFPERRATPPATCHRCGGSLPARERR